MNIRERIAQGKTLKTQTSQKHALTRSYPEALSFIALRHWSIVLSTSSNWIMSPNECEPWTILRTSLNRKQMHIPATVCLTNDIWPHLTSFAYFNIFCIILYSFALLNVAGGMLQDSLHMLFHTSFGADWDFHYGAQAVDPTCLQTKTFLRNISTHYVHDSSPFIIIIIIIRTCI